ncbi:hypothetical protein D3C80_1262360 [compost metagenome]
MRFNYQTQLPAHVLVNGQELQLITGSQSVKVTEGQYTIYGDIQLSALPEQDTLQLKISYDTLSGDTRLTLDNPWLFDVTVSAEQIAKDIQTIDMDQTITLNNGNKIQINKIVLSPVSTLLYYTVADAATFEDTVIFKLVSPFGGEIPSRESYDSGEAGELSYVRYGPVDLAQGTYSIVPIALFDNREEVGPPVQIK